MASRRDEDQEAMFQVLACYYNQDADLLADTMIGLRDVAVRESAPEHLQRFLREAARLRAQAPDDAALAELIEAGGGIEVDPLWSGELDSWSAWLGDLEDAMCAVLAGSRQLALDPDVADVLERLVRAALEASRDEQVIALPEPWGGDMERFIAQVLRPLGHGAEGGVGEREVTVLAEDIEPLRSLLDGFEATWTTAAEWVPASVSERRAADRLVGSLRAAVPVPDVQEGELTVSDPWDFYSYGDDPEIVVVTMERTVAVGEGVGVLCSFRGPLSYRGVAYDRLLCIARDGGALTDFDGDGAAVEVCAYGLRVGFVPDDLDPSTWWRGGLAATASLVWR